MNAVFSETFNPVSASIDAAQAPVTPWNELQPLMARIDPAPYPVEALPTIVRRAVEEVAGFVKAPTPLIAASALAALSLAIQAHTDVERAQRLTGPCGLFMLSIADSGERKSSCDGFFTKAIRDYEAQQQEDARPLMKDYATDHEIWEAKRAGLKERIKTGSRGAKSTAKEESELHALDKETPVPPRVPRMIFGDATPEALQFSLAKKWPSAGVISSEAGSVFGGAAMGKDSQMRNLAVLNQLWDGASLPVERRSSESYTVKGARLTMALQVQESTLRAFFDGSKGLARGTGFLARFLVSWPASTQGMRPFTEAPTNWPALAAFNDRLAAILARPVPINEEGALEPGMLKLSPEAKAVFVSYHDHIESKLSNGSDLYEIRDVASKIADNATRIAALFHVFEGHSGPIEAKTMETAARVASWHMNEARRFLGELSMPEDLANPMRLEAYLIDYCKRYETDKVPTGRVQQFGPNGLRNKEKIRVAVAELEEMGRARMRSERRKRFIQVRSEVIRGAL